MVVTNGYCELVELQDWNKADLAIDVANLEQAINACSRGIDQFCQRHFWKTTSQARVLDAENTKTLRLGPFNDLTTVTAVKTDENRDGLFEQTWAASDYQTLPLNSTAAPEQRPFRTIRSTGTRCFPMPFCSGRVGLVEVTGEWGWPAIPAAVKQACLIHAARIFYRKETPGGVAGWGDFGAIRLGRTDPDVIGLLEPYRLTPVLVA